MTENVVSFYDKRYFEKMETRAYRVAVTSRVEASCPDEALTRFASDEAETLSSEVLERYRPHEAREYEKIELMAPKSGNSWTILHVGPRYVTYVHKVIAATQEEAERLFKGGRGKFLTGFVGDRIPKDDIIRESMAVTDVSS